jgi:hypothetical protein
MDENDTIYENDQCLLRGSHPRNAKTLYARQDAISQGEI